MKNNKKKWKPKITCHLADGTIVEASEVVIPSDHQYYNVAHHFTQQKGA